MYPTILHFKKQISTVLIVFLAGALAYIQSVNFPFVPFTDAICFLPQAVMFAQGEGFRNVYQFNYLPDGGFIWHGFLFPMVLGGLFKTDTYLKVSLTIAVLNTINILLLAVTLLRFTSKWSPLPKLLFLAVALLTQIGFLQGLLGRPESLTSLLLGWGILLWSFKPSLTLYSIIGCIVGLLAVTSPIPAIYASAFFIIGIVFRENLSSRLIRILLLVAAGALLAMALSFLFYPYSIEQWFWGMKQHANNVIKDPSGNNFALIVRQFFISSGRFMMGFVFAGCWAAAAYLVLRSNKGNLSIRMLLFLLLALVGILIFRISIKIQYYYIICLFPVAIVCAAVFLSDNNTLFKLSLKICICLSLILSSLDPILLQVGAMLGCRSLPLVDARKMFADDLEMMTGRVTISMDLIVLADRTERLQVLYDYVPKCNEPETDWLVVQQYCFFYDDPPDYQNFYLVENRFVKKNKLPGRLAQWFGVNGYGYAIYKRKSERRFGRLSSEKLINCAIAQSTKEIQIFDYRDSSLRLGKSSVSHLTQEYGPNLMSERLQDEPRSQSAWI